ncbi:hypothetical protein THIOM_000762 [Candidatus Thiomargarita nelsonii]|uniref:Uncharacterized protein n=1 Tax=Candidatus Thiomargarita nelsonii TaxID=1003181 RepID=A0A176S6C7_9GAMM|nr:hypothetical protein THIOM_000762 [Candidatus Thiomargarita nelsonii]
MRLKLNRLVPYLGVQNLFWTSLTCVLVQNKFWTPKCQKFRDKSNTRFPFDLSLLINNPCR